MGYIGRVQKNISVREARANFDHAHIIAANATEVNGTRLFHLTNRFLATFSSLTQIYGRSRLVVEGRVLKLAVQPSIAE
jgi:hypothetical protein